MKGQGQGCHFPFFILEEDPCLFIDTGRGPQDLGGDLIGLGAHEVADEGQGVDADVRRAPPAKERLKKRFFMS